MIKKIILLTLVFVISTAAPLMAKLIPCGTYNGKNLYKGEKGGCFYLKSKKKIKVYVDKKLCNCK